MSLPPRGKWGWVGMVLARGAAVSGVVLAVITIVLRLNGRGFSEGCGGETQVWYYLGIYTLVASLSLIPVAILVLRLLDRTRGTISLLCSACSFLLLFFAPWSVC